MFFCRNHDSQTPRSEIVDKTSEVFSKMLFSLFKAIPRSGNGIKASEVYQIKKRRHAKTRAWRLEYLEPDRITPTR
jgi:hypothetical protein